MYYALVLLLVSFFSMDLFLYVRTVKMAIANWDCRRVFSFLFWSFHSFVQFPLPIFICVKKKRLLSLRQYSTRHLRLDLTFVLPVVIYLYTAHTLVRARCSKPLTALHISDKVSAICDRDWCSAHDFTLTLTMMLSRYLCAALCNCVFIVLPKQGFSNEYPCLATLRFMLHKRRNKLTNPQMISDTLRQPKELHFDVHSTKNKFLLRVQVFIFLRIVCNNRDV